MENLDFKITSDHKRVLAWFSCGVASAVATKLALAKYKGVLPVEIIYQDTNSEHPDNARFGAECEQWFGQEIQIHKSKKYKDIWDVFNTGWLIGVHGAMCTSVLKRKVAEDYIDWFHDIEIFGYTLEEQNRIKKFKKNNPERIIDPILIEYKLSKQDCHAMLKEAGIEIPVMYKLGYKNNNCIGCVKGGMGYWNKIRIDFPETFDRMAKLERKLDVAMLHEEINGERVRLFLDTLEPIRGNYKTESDISCGIMCQSAIDDIVEKEDENC